MRKLAVEGASAPMSIENLDWDKVERLRGHTELIKALDSWILIADRRLIPQMAALGELVKKIYEIPHELTLFRGFNINGFQDNMGVGQIPHVGQVIHYDTDDRALSFSTDIDIAKAFGSIVMTIKLDTRKASFLDITDELSYLVHECRNLKDYTTQREVILLPPVSFQAKIVQAKRSIIGSLGW